MEPDGPIALIGMRCSGKTEVGRELARLLGRPFVDADEHTLVMGRRAGHDFDSAGALLAGAGPAVFRDLEAAALRPLLEPRQRLVVATGGGAVERADNRSWLARTAFCVWLDVPVDVLQARLRADGTSRPPLTGADPVSEVPAVLARRAPLYAAVAQLRLECGERAPAELALAIRDALGSAAGPAAEPGPDGHPRPA